MILLTVLPHIHIQRLMHTACPVLPQVHAKSTSRHRWLVVADAAAYVPTHRLDLLAVQPDFVPISFYKLFGKSLCAISKKIYHDVT